MFEPGDNVRCINIHPDQDEAFFSYASYMAITDGIFIGGEYIIGRFHDGYGKSPSVIRVPDGEYSHPVSMFEPAINLQTTMDLLDQKVAEYEQRLTS